MGIQSQWHRSGRRTPSQLRESFLKVTLAKQLNKNTKQALCNNVWSASDLNHKNPNVFLITFFFSCVPHRRADKMRKHVELPCRLFSHKKKSDKRSRRSRFLSNFLFCCVHIFLDWLKWKLLQASRTYNKFELIQKKSKEQFFCCCCRRRLFRCESNKKSRGRTQNANTFNRSRSSSSYF